MSLQLTFPVMESIVDKKIAQWESKGKFEINNIFWSFLRNIFRSSLVYSFIGNKLEFFIVFFLEDMNR